MSFKTKKANIIAAKGGPETIIKVSDLNAKQKANQARHFSFRIPHPRRYTELRTNENKKISLSFCGTGGFL
jgi:hypothetical protein